MEVCPQGPYGHQGREVLVRDGHQTDIDAPRCPPPNPLAHSLPEDWQELDLCRRFQITDCLKEARTTPYVGS